MPFAAYSDTAPIEASNMYSGLLCELHSDLPSLMIDAASFFTH
jgi:hypothetical protein